MPSSPEPAAHSPVAVPEAVSVLAAVIASLRVHSPSVAIGIIGEAVYSYDGSPGGAGGVSEEQPQH